jgi:CYTH domain-containing protein
VGDGQEIERKFVVREPPPFDLDDHPCEAISQGYIAVSPEGTEVRVRSRGDRRSLGVKSGPSRTRVEEEIELDGRQFDSLWRFTIAADSGHAIELDVYEGDLSGLVTAEIEFDSEQAADSFEPAPWLGDEVTGDPAYSNQSLAANGRPA